MVTIVISGHGELSNGILSASEMIFGEQKELHAIPFKKGEGIQDLQAKYQQVLSETEGEVLFLVDIFGGTPYNSAAQTIFANEKADMLTGVNLPILLETLSARETKDLKQLVKHLKQTARDSFRVFSEEIREIKNTNQENEEDDEL